MFENNLIDAGVKDYAEEALIALIAPLNTEEELLLLKMYLKVNSGRDDADFDVYKFESLQTKFQDWREFTKQDFKDPLDHLIELLLGRNDSNSSATVQLSIGYPPSMTSFDLRQLMQYLTVDLGFNDESYVNYLQGLNDQFLAWMAENNLMQYDPAELIHLAIFEQNQEYLVVLSMTTEEINELKGYIEAYESFEFESVDNLRFGDLNSRFRLWMDIFYPGFDDVRSLIDELLLPRPVVKVPGEEFYFDQESQEQFYELIHYYQKFFTEESLTLDEMLVLARLYNALQKQ